MANGTSTTNQTLGTTHIFHIALTKLINGVSAINTLIAKSTTAIVAVALPDTVQKSSPPVSGKFRIRCIDGNGYYSDTDDINYNENARWIQHAVERKCNKMYDKVEIWRDTVKCPYSENCIAFWMRYVGKNEKVGQASIISGVATVLGGNTTSKQNVTVPYGKNLFYEPIPFEMLRTYETQPQVIVTVGDNPAVCHNLTCHFNYSVPQGEVTAYTYTTATKVLTLTGTNLPANASLIRHVEFAHSKCSISASSNTSLTCTLDHIPVCGSHLPNLVAKQGSVNSSASLSATVIGCTATSIVPTTQLNLLGGDNLTITGTNLPWNMATSNIDITLSDAQSTKCIP